jgi:hypothetical protein
MADLKGKICVRLEENHADFQMLEASERVSKRLRYSQSGIYKGAFVLVFPSPSEVLCDLLH